MAVYAIGDVQGCFTALLALLDRLHFDRTRDRLWFAGDLVNRGPQSLEVLRFVKALGDGAVTVLGNHDLHLLTVAYGRGRLKPKDTFTDVLAVPDRDDLLTWLRHRPLRYITHCLTRLRFCDAAGRLNDEATGPPGSQPPPYMPWFAIPHRASADLNIVFGHWSALGLYQAPGVYGLDTGCVWGGALTALCLETRQHVSVQCGTAQPTGRAT